MRQSLADNKQMLEVVVRDIDLLYKDFKKKGLPLDPEFTTQVLDRINSALLDVIEKIEEHESGLATVNQQLALDIDKLDKRIKALEKK